MRPAAGMFGVPLESLGMLTIHEIALRIAIFGTFRQLVRLRDRILVDIDFDYTCAAKQRKAPATTYPGSLLTCQITIKIKLTVDAHQAKGSAK